MPIDWLEFPQYNGVQVSFYASSLGVANDWSEISDATDAVLSLDYPYKIGVLIGVQEFGPTRVSGRVSYSLGQRHIHTSPTQAPVPNGDYLFIATPIENAPSGHTSALDRVRTIRGALVILFGHTSAEEAAASILLHSNGNHGAFSPVFEVFLDIGSFSFVPKAWLVKLSSRKEHLTPDVLRRLGLALQFMERSAGRVDPIARFSDAWIALEIAAQGKPDKLIKSISPSGQKAGLLGELDRARNSLFHHGVAPTISKYAERVIFLAILSDAFSSVGIDTEEIKAKVSEMEAETQTAQ